MSGTNEKHECGSKELTFSSEQKIDDKQSHTMLVIWKLFGFLKSDDGQIKTVGKTFCWLVPTKIQLVVIYILTSRCH